MRIGIDATAAGIAGSPHTGVYQYMYQLIRAMGRQSPESEWRLFFALPRRRHSPAIRAFGRALDLPNLVSRRSPIPGRYLMRWRIPVDLFTGRLDVFHAPAHIGYARHRCPLVVTVHDLAYRRDLASPAMPAGFGAAAAAGWQDRRRFFAELDRHMARSVAAAARVITVSQHTADDLVATLGVDRAKVRVVYPGVREEMHRAGPQERSGVFARRGLEEGCFLFVGSLDPNKNVQTLLQGYAQYRQAGGRRSLAIAGHSDYFGALLQAQCQLLRIESHVRFLGFVDDADLPSLYSGARAVIMPSPLEGFGFPAVEAMACGTPVIGADAGALPEVMGAAGILVRHDRPRAFADALDRIEHDGALHSQLVERGHARAAEFTWRRAAQQTLAVYAEAACPAGRALEAPTGVGSEA